MKRKPSLGKVARNSYSDFLAAIREAVDEVDGMGAQELGELKETDEPRWKSYKLMNGLGYRYGAELARALTSRLSPEDEDLPAKINAATHELSMFYNDLEAHRSLQNEGAFRQAVEDLPALVPSWVDPDAILREAYASYEGRGVYWNDFHYSAMTAISSVIRALRYFTLNENRPEVVSFRKERGGGEFIPEAVLSLSEEEERTLLKNVIRETNRRIGSLGSYGVRTEPLPEAGDFTILYWANGPAEWFVDQRTRGAMIARSNGTKGIPLDSNMVLTPFHEVVVQKVVGALDDLPLYSYSIEAKERGEYPPPTDQNVRLAIREILKGELRHQDPEELAIDAMELFDLFKKAKAGDRGSQVLVGEMLAAMQNWLPYARLITEWMELR